MAPMFTHDVSLESDSPCVFNDSSHWTNGRTYHAFAAYTWCSKNPVHPYTSVYIMNCIGSWLLNFVGIGNFGARAVALPSSQVTWQLLLQHSLPGDVQPWQRG